MSSTRPFIAALLAGLCACGGNVTHAPVAPVAPVATTSVPDASMVDGARAWELLSRSLPGTWLRESVEGKPPFLVSYRLISGGSALVEVWGVGGARETETVLHRDHGDVMLTHYCAQGNQPRLRAARAGSDLVEFRFVDVTNRAPEQDMLVQRTLRFGKDTLEITEVYRRPDGTDETTVHRFTRRPPTSS